MRRATCLRKPCERIRGGGKSARLRGPLGFLAAPSREAHVPRDRQLGTAPRTRDKDVQRWVRPCRAPARGTPHEEREGSFVESEVRRHFVLRLGNPSEVALVFVVVPMLQRARSAAVFPEAPAVAGLAAAPVAPGPPPSAAVPATWGVILFKEGQRLRSHTRKVASPSRCNPLAVTAFRRK